MRWYDIFGRMADTTKAGVFFRRDGWRMIVVVGHPPIYLPPR